MKRNRLISMATHNDDKKRTALLIRCSAEEADLIRQAATVERRTISGYILNCIMRRIAVNARSRKHFEEKFRRFRRDCAKNNRLAPGRNGRPVAGTGELPPRQGGHF
jgi:hypothetical protein